MSQGRRTRHFGVSILPSSRASGEMPRSPRLAHVRLIECTNVRWLVESNFPRGVHDQSGSTIQIWVVMRHQYGISALVFQTSFGRETSGSVAKCRLFSQATTTVPVKNLTSILTFKFSYG